ncbi:ankyrin [Penicillium sp. IBT 16267x]|nr:ankyrin [Penicillium sp. IBT 16267x]
MSDISFGPNNSGLQILTNNGLISANFYPPPGYKDINPSRVKGTCRWFLDHPTFQKWRNSDHDDLLWVSADSGCGKSVLSKALVDSELVHHGPATICYFFFKRNEEQNNIETAVCALLHQICCNQQDLFQKHAKSAISQHGEGLKRDFGTLWHVWTSIAVASTKDVICVLDALDECCQQGRERLIQELGRFYITSREREYVGSKVKFLITSRPYGDIEWAFGKLMNHFPKLAAEDEWQTIRAEIHLVLEAKVNEIVEKRHLDDDIRTALQRRFSETPNTTYLWLYLILNALKRS